MKTRFMNPSGHLCCCRGEMSLQAGSLGMQRHKGLLLSRTLDCKEGLVEMCLYWPASENQFIPHSWGNRDCVVEILAVSNVKLFLNLVNTAYVLSKMSLRVTEATVWARRNNAESFLFHLWGGVKLSDLQMSSSSTRSTGHLQTSQSAAQLWSRLGQEQVIKGDNIVSRLHHVHRIAEDGHGLLQSILPSSAVQDSKDVDPHHTDALGRPEQKEKPRFSWSLFKRRSSGRECR